MEYSKQPASSGYATGVQACLYKFKIAHTFIRKFLLSFFFHEISFGQACPANLWPAFFYGHPQLSVLNTD